MTDCIIVGGGLIGMLSAYELKKMGQDVLVIDKGLLGHESSWAGGGILSPLHPWQYGDEVNQLAQEGHRIYPQLAEELQSHSGIDPEYRRSGLLVVESDEQDAAVEWAKKYEMEIELPQSAAEIQSILPGASASLSHGIWLPAIGQLRNPRLVKSVKGAIQALGVRIMENTPVDRLEVVNQQIKGVVANGHTYHSDRVLIAGGAWSADILREYADVPNIEPVKGQMILFKGEPDRVKTMLLSGSRYLIPRKDGRVLCGSSIERSGFDKTTSQQVKDELTQSAIDLFPGLSEYEVEHHWAGLRPGSPQGVPYIAEHQQVQGLYINAGHFRNGVILGIASARKVAKIIHP